MKDVDFSGPLFDGRAEAAGRRLVRDIRDTLSDEGEEMVRRQLGRVLRHPTGYYESQVRSSVRGSHDAVVTDGGVVYGPWLEGTGSRNETTRFKGYRTFRVVTDELNRLATGLIEPDVERAVRGME